MLSHASSVSISYPKTLIQHTPYSVLASQSLLTDGVYFRLLIDVVQKPGTRLGVPSTNLFGHSSRSCPACQPGNSICSATLGVSSLTVHSGRTVIPGRIDWFADLDDSLQSTRPKPPCPYLGRILPHNSNNTEEFLPYLQFTSYGKWEWIEDGSWKLLFFRLIKTAKSKHWCTSEWPGPT